MVDLTDCLHIKCSECTLLKWYDILTLDGQYIYSWYICPLGHIEKSIIKEGSKSESNNKIKS